jgi:hypothetical protein
MVVDRQLSEWENHVNFFIIYVVVLYCILRIDWCTGSLISFLARINVNSLSSYAKHKQYTNHLYPTTDSSRCSLLLSPTPKTIEMAKTSKTNKSHYDQALDILGITGRLAQTFQECKQPCQLPWTCPVSNPNSDYRIDWITTYYSIFYVFSTNNL